MESVGSARPRVGPGAAVGIDEAMIRAQVHGFYGQIRVDPALGPIFNREIQDWEPHLEKMCDFWSSVLLMTARFKGSPMTTHARLEGLRPTHFAHWLHLFRQTARTVCPPAAADLFIAKAEMIAESLQLGIAAARGEIAPLGSTAG
jgi:hemoglobin